ncbi:hypothetical protein [Bordetella hinzii]|uniref:hypothetical protein n=1 Tax=Bordetella hinzii TaxID=103855 RepID=UPI0039FC26EC
MNEQNSAVQPLLTGDEIRAAVRQAHSMTAPSDTTEPGDYVMAGVRALLSKLRAPVADETQALHDHDLWFQEYGQTLGAFYNNLTIHTRAAWVAASRQYAALASAPVAGEAVAWVSDTAGATDNPKLAETWRKMGWPVRPLVYGDAAPQASPVAGEAQPVAWVAADTLNSPHPTCISSLAYMSQLDQERGREYVPLYAAPVAAQTADDARDADMFWNADDPEQFSATDLQGAVEYIMDDYRPSDLPMELDLLCARSMPNVQVRVTGYNEADGWQYEVVDAAMAAEIGKNMEKV